MFGRAHDQKKPAGTHEEPGINRAQRVSSDPSGPNNVSGTSPATPSFHCCYQLVLEKSDQVGAK